MRAHSIAAAAVAALTLTVVSPVMAQTPDQKPDPLVGEWHLDLANSKFSPGPAPKSIHLTVEATPNGTKAVSEQVTSDGQKLRIEFTAMSDGKDYPITGSPTADTVSITRSGNTRTRTDKKGGKVVMTYNGTLSSDGQRFTVQQKGTGSKGEKVSNTLVFRKG